MFTYSGMSSQEQCLQVRTALEESERKSEQIQQELTDVMVKLRETEEERDTLKCANVDLDRKMEVCAYAICGLPMFLDNVCVCVCVFMCGWCCFVCVCDVCMCVCVCDMCMCVCVYVCVCLYVYVCVCVCSCVVGGVVFVCVCDMCVCML